MCTEKLIYDNGKNRFKHKWNKNSAGFITKYGNVIGKCPTSMGQEVAEDLLSNAIPISQEEFQISDKYPKKLYNVYKGVIFCAIGSGRDNRYHGFPADNIGMIEKEIFMELEKRAEKEGFLEVFKKWAKDYKNKGHEGNEYPF